MARRIGREIAPDAGHVLVIERDLIRESFVAEVHPDHLKGEDGRRSPANGANPMVEIAILYGCASHMDYPCRVKTTLKLHADKRQRNRICIG